MRLTAHDLWYRHGLAAGRKGKPFPAGWTSRWYREGYRDGQERQRVMDDACRLVFEALCKPPDTP